MPRVTLRLVIDPGTRERRVLVEYESEPDALPLEHEEGHRRVVEALLGSQRLGSPALAGIAIDREAALPTGSAATATDRGECSAESTAGEAGVELASAGAGARR